MEMPKIDTMVKVGALIGMLFAATQYFATAAHVQMVEMRLDQKIVNDQSWALKQRMYQLEDRNRKDGPNPVNWSNTADRDEYRALQRQLHDNEGVLQKSMEKSK